MTENIIEIEALDQLPASAADPNRLMNAAYPLLECIPQLRHGQPLELDSLHDKLVKLMTAFSQNILQAGFDEETASMCRYCLCALIDEVIADTSWGTDAWARRSLLVTFHQETSGGERFFGILQWLAREPRQHSEQLEYMYALLALGMEGRYRLVVGGREELAQLRERLYQQLCHNRGASETALAPAWRQTRPPQPSRHARLLRNLAIALPILLLATYLALDAQLAEHSLPTPVPVALRTLGAQGGNDAAALALARLLAEEIRLRQLMLEVQPDRTILTLRVDTLFASGRAEPLPANLPLLQVVARALASIPGRIEVAGHSDNQPTAAGTRDNRQLSLDRAIAVANLLAAGGVGRQRLTTAGRGPDEPLVANDTPANRARNRRVVITLFNSGAGT
jgi:type VI secretion system protein ImpK